MLRFCPLFSSSSGNSVYIGDRDGGILVDVGRSAKQTDLMLNKIGVDISSVKGIFITHEHTDHVNGLSVFAARHNIPVYAAPGTLLALKNKGVLTAKHVDIALNTGIASGATAVVIPEFPHDDNSICKKIKAGRDIGKRNFIVIVSEGVGAAYGPALTEKIESTTGVEARFARLAHIVRGGNPSLRDRILASRLGVLAGNSNIVVCERDNQTIAEDIYFALTMDAMYKNKLKDGDLDRFSPEEIERMQKAVDLQKQMKLELYGIENKINI